MENVTQATLSLALSSTETSTQGTSANYSNTSDAGLSPSSASLGKIFLPAIMTLIGILGNVMALVILQVRPSKDSRSTAFYHLVKALAVVDLVGIVATSPVPLATQGQLMKNGGMGLCHYFSFALVLAGDATLAIVLVMAVERFLITKFPFQYPNIVTRRNLNVVIVTLWLISALFAALPIMGIGRNTDRFPGTWCFFDYRDGSIDSYIISSLYAGAGIIIVVVTFVLNTLVIHHLWRMRRSRLIQSSVRSAPSQPSRKGPDSETKMVLFLMAIILVFTACYSPLMVRVLMNQYLNTGGVKVGGIDDRLDLWTLRLASLNQIVDPWVYIISRFTCCSSSSRRNSRTGNPSRPPNRTILTTVSESPSPKKSLFGRSVEQARAIFHTARPDDRKLDKTMVPLATEFPEPMVLPSVRLGDEVDDTTNIVLDDGVGGAGTTRH